MLNPPVTQRSIPRSCKGPRSVTGPTTTSPATALVYLNLPLSRTSEKIHLQGFKKAWHKCRFRIYPASQRVTDGARTRDLRSHNPLSSVSERCCTLQNRLK